MKITQLFGFKNLWLVACFSLLLLSCQPQKQNEEMSRKSVKIVTVDPGHFHAALVQKSMYEDVDSVVYVYAPGGNDVQLHLDRINKFNTRPEDPTHWKEEVYTGTDFFEKMISEKKGNVVVLSGNNQKKTEYISRSLEAGLNVLADKPMVIGSEGFDALKVAFETAKKNDLLLYDIMTERFEISTMLQKELSMIPEVFGTLVNGTPDNPAVTKESVHHFYKYVSGSVLTRPAWFMDVTQAGEGVVDVTTHLVDLVQWECFPEQTLDYTKDIELISAKRTATEMTQSEFTAITKVETFPDYLKSAIVNDSILRVYCNGEINYKLRGVHAKVSVTWAYKAPEGAGDTHYSIMRGTLANLIIRQGADQQYKPTLYIEPLAKDPAFEQVLMEKMKDVSAKYPGVEVSKNEKGWEVIIPDSYKEGHEAHFARVMEKFLEYLKNKNMPAWEVPNMVAKYYTTTKALELAQKE
jgi:predicted dehydrogenase